VHRSQIKQTVRQHTNKLRKEYNPSKRGRSWDLNPGKRLHRPLGYQATSPRPLFPCFRMISAAFAWYLKVMAYTLFSFSEDLSAIVESSRNVFETNLYKGTGFLWIMSYSRYKEVFRQVFEQFFLKLNV
jgi:hypothetical protein